MQEVHSYIKKECNVMQEVRHSIPEVCSYIKNCAEVRRREVREVREVRSVI